VVRSSRLHGIDIDPKIVPRAIDEFPVLCVAASLAEGRTTIRGASELRVKESDRISTMATELRKMGVDIEELEDGLIINGREDLLPATLNSHGDHRVAMALMIAAMRARDECIIENIECVNISFPQFPFIIERLR
jgi:3-phosphoshikimate 1-carboxyvinyltransferase